MEYYAQKSDCHALNTASQWTKRHSKHSVTKNSAFHYRPSPSNFYATKCLFNPTNNFSLQQSPTKTLGNCLIVTTYAEFSHNHHQFWIFNSKKSLSVLSKNTPQPLHLLNVCNSTPNDEFFHMKNYNSNLRTRWTNVHFQLSKLLHAGQIVERFCMARQIIIVAELFRAEIELFIITWITFPLASHEHKLESVSAASVWRLQQKNSINFSVATRM
jgi:hypothetical protein